MSVDLGLVSVLGTDAVGQPGQRRFRLFLRAAQGSAIIWLEKQQLAGLSEALDRTLALITEGQILRTEARAGGLITAKGMPADFPRYPTHDVQVGQMRLSFDEDDTFFSLRIVPLDVLLERDQEAEEDVFDDASISFQFSQQQAQELSVMIQTVVASGRPVCPLCHAPLDGGPHACVKQNGHREIIRIEEIDDENP
jgi:uncharacterized repeat protein (TIGR03847 family)